MKPLRAIIDKRGDFGAARLSQSARAPALHPGRSTAVENTALWWRHLGERFEGLAFRQNGSLASGNVGLAVGFRIVRQRRTRGVQHHAFGPFMIRMDPDVDLLIERNVRRVESIGAGKHQFAASSAASKKASYPPEILKQRHGQRASTRVRGLQFAAAGLAEIA